MKVKRFVRISNLFSFFVTAPPLLISLLSAPFFALFLLFPSTSSFAACANPAGNEGEMLYNADYKTMQFCDGTNWWSMKGGGGGGGGGLLFTNQTGVALNSTITSNTITSPVAGTATCGAGCTAISINGGAFVAGPVTGVAVGDTIAIRQTSSASTSTATTAIVSIGATMSSSWQITTTSAASAFSFTDQTDVALSATITSNAVALAGGFTNLTATCGAGCTAISINGGAFVAGPVAGVNSGDTIAIRQTSSATINTATTATISVGPTTSGAWSVTTVNDPCAVPSPTVLIAGPFIESTSCGSTVTYKNLSDSPETCFVQYEVHQNAAGGAGELGITKQGSVKINNGWDISAVSAAAGQTLTGTVNIRTWEASLGGTLAQLALFSSGNCGSTGGYAKVWLWK